MTRPVLVGALAIVVLCAGTPAFAQRVTSSLTGTVTDTSGAVVAAAQVTVLALETGQQRSTTTDDRGQYRIAGLGPGFYELRAEHAGFARAVLSAIELQVNQEVVVDAMLQVGALTDQVDVKAHPSMIDATSSHLSGIVNDATLRELPLNGRDVFQLTLLQPGVAQTTNAGPNPWADGPIAKATVQGTRPTMNNVTLDGADVNDPAFNLPPGGVSGNQMGVDAVREYRVLSSGYSAEFGRNAGANVQLVTRSGTNELHGSVFEFHRNAALDAPNVFDAGGDVPPFVRNQFGMALGGPIERNRTFFFGNFEGFHERRSITTSISVPDPAARRGLLPSAASPGTLASVGVNPSVAPFLNLFPLPNGESLGGGLAAYRGSEVQPTRDDYALVRIDRTTSRGGLWFGRYVLDDSHSTVPFISTYVPGFAGDRSARNQYLMVASQQAFGAALLSEAKVNLSRTNYLARADNSYPLSISLLPNRPLGAIAVAGLPAIGNNLIYPLGTASTTIEAIENLTYQEGGHLLKIGADAKRMRMDGPFDLFVNGQYQFNDLTPFGLPALSTNPPLEAFLQATPFLYLGVDPAAADSYRRFRQTYVGAYLQDDWRVTPGLTLNLGMRWEFWSNPSEADGRLANIRNVQTDSQPTVGPVWEHVPLDLWSPRAGFAWTPAAGGKTAIRAGIGLLRDQLWNNLYSDVRFYEPFYRPLLYILPTFLASPAGVAAVNGLGGPPSVIGSFGITYRPDFPYYIEDNINVQHQLTPDLMVQVGYVGSRGKHLPRTGEANPLVAALGRRLNPAFGSIPLLVTDAQSWYDAMQVSLVHRTASGLMFQASYTLAKSTDDQSGPFPSDYVSESGVSQDFFAPTAERGRSSFDRRHVFVLNYLYDLPFGRSRSTGWGSVASRWSVGGIVTLMSGLPFTANLGSFNNSGNFASFPADRPDVKPGVDACAGVTGDPNRWFDPSIFKLPAPGAYGNAGRNILCGPDFRNVDIQISKVQPLRGSVRLQLRAEVFNLLNRANFDVPVNTQGPNGSGGNGDAIFIGRQGAACNPATDASGCGVLAPNAGRIFRTVTTSRQMQLAVRLLF
jgi:carboxypeptidase family protein/TonB-dependent receptor-like protein